MQTESIDSSVGQEKKIRKSRVMAVVSSRDLHVLKLCYEQGLLTRRQLRTWLLQRYALKNVASAKSAAIRILASLRDQSLVNIFSVQTDCDKEAFCLTAKGLSALLDNGFRFTQKHKEVIWTPDKINHDIKVTDVRLSWENMLPKCYWYPELFLKLNHPEPLPDALMGYYSAKLISHVTVGIEVELTQKSRSRYYKKFKAYSLKESPFDLIFYFTTSQTISNKILEVSAGASNTIYVIDLELFVQNPIEAEFVSHSKKFSIKEKMEYVWKE